MSWNELDQESKYAFMQLCVAQGITDLQLIIQIWEEQYANQQGGQQLMSPEELAMMEQLAMLQQLQLMPLGLELIDPQMLQLMMAQQGQQMMYDGGYTYIIPDYNDMYFGAPLVAEYGY